MINIKKNRRQCSFTKEELSVQIRSDANGYGSIQAPDSVNWPEYPSNPDSFIIRLPEVPDLSDPVNKPFKIYVDEINDENELTIVNNKPTVNNTYRLADPEADANDIIEISSNLTSKKICYDYFSRGSLLHADDYNNIDCQTIKAERLSSDLDCNEMRLDNIQNVKSSYNDEFELFNIHIDAISPITFDFILKKPISAFFLGKLSHLFAFKMNGLTIKYSGTYYTRFYIYQNANFRQIFEIMISDQGETVVDDYANMLCPGKYRIEILFKTKGSCPAPNEDIKLICSGVFGQNTANIDDVIEVIEIVEE